MSQALIKSWRHQGYLFGHDIVAYGSDWSRTLPRAPLSKNWVILLSSLTDEEVKGG